MALLPDNTFFGTSPSADERAFWLDGATQDATPPAGDAVPSSKAGTVTPFDALKQAQADAEYLTKIHDAQRAMSQVNDPADVRAYEPYLRAANEARAAVFDNPDYGHLWAQERDAEAKQLISTRVDEVSRQQTVATTDGWLAQLHAAALQSSGDDTAHLIDAGMRLIQGLKGSGHIDEAAAQDRQRHWVQTYAKAWIEMRPAKERLALLGDAPVRDGIVADIQSGDGDAAHRTGTPADFLPPEDIDRIRLQAQSELERNATRQSWQKAAEYDRRIVEAELGSPKPAPWRAEIVADPDLDPPARTRLLKQYDAMQVKLNRFWSNKADYDKPNGRTFNSGDDKDREFADQIYAWLGADDAALNDVIGRTDILPDAALVQFRTHFRSQDPAEVKQALTALGRLTYRFNRLLTSNGKEASDLQNDLAEFQYYRRSGLSEKQAIGEFIKMRLPEAEVQRQANLKSIDIDAVVKQATPPALFDRVFGGYPAVTPSDIATYRGLLRERLTATAKVEVAKAQTNAQLKPLLDARAEDAARQDAAGRPSWTERAWLNGLDAFINGTFAGSGWFRDLKKLADRVEATRPEDMEKLLDEIKPGLAKLGWSERRQYELQWLKSAPERFKKIQADLDRYKEMKLSGSASEFSAAVTGQIVGSMLSPESYIGWQVKGASWLVRGFKTAIQQAGIAGVADLATQKNLVEAGAQNEVDLSRAGGVATGAAITGGVTSAVGKSGRAQNESPGITPEGLPKQHAPSPDVELAPVTARPDVLDVTPQELPRFSDQKPDYPVAAVPPLEVQAAILQPAQAPSQIMGGIDQIDPNLPVGTSGTIEKSAAAQKNALIEDSPSTGRIAPPKENSSEFKTPWQNEDASGSVEQRVAKIEELKSMHPVSDKYTEAQVGKGGVERYADTFHASTDDKLKGKVEVHRNVEKKILERCPGLFRIDEVNSLPNLRGIPKDRFGTALHRSIIRKKWDAFYVRCDLVETMPTKEDVLRFATEIDRLYGGLYYPPL